LTSRRSAEYASGLLRKLGAFAAPVVSVAMLFLALWFLHHELAGLTRAEIAAHLRSVPRLSIAAAIGFTLLSYLVLTAYDATGLRYIQQVVPYRRSALIAFMAYAVGHNIGMVALSGGSIRYRMYSMSGLSATDIVRLIFFVSLTFFLGAALLLGAALVSVPIAESQVIRLSPVIVKSAGVLLLLFPVAYLGMSVFRKTPLTFRNWRIAVPGPRIAATQIVISIADLVFSAATLFVLLAPSTEISFLHFLAIYLLAMAAGVISSVPGGIGVFEAVLVAALPQLHPAELIGTIIIYRLIYYVAPLILAILLLVATEARQHGRAIQKTASTASAMLSGIAPQVVGIAVFIAGCVLLISGASPAIESRLQLVSRYVPLYLLEASHLAASITGVSLLIVARGLFRRLRGAYFAAMLALLAGIVLSLVKGFDFEEALILGAVATVLFMSRNEFYRSGSIASQQFPASWVTAIVIVIGIVGWIMLTTFRNVAYTHDLWWQFTVTGDAPRSMRAGVVVAVGILCFGLWKIVRNLPVGRELIETDPYTDPRVRDVVAQATDTTANLAFLGDKRFLWSEDGRGFIMYQVVGDSWIAMADPVGPPECRAKLAWAFRELVDQHDGKTVFYQVSDASLALYVDLGLVLVKLGEDARVPLRDFSLQGPERAELRQAHNRGRKSGAVFDVVPRLSVPAIVADLRRVSDNWLEQKSTSEKGFSLGAFSDSYVAQFDCAVVRVGGKIIAFANIWQAPAGSELSIDLMRHDADAPKGIMDYLFVELMLWGAANGYDWFSLGMAPLSGMEQRSLAPLWHKFGHLVYSHGENFYNFEGLRHYKEKFDPQWQSRYLACPRGWLSLPLVLLDVSRLISGGLTKILR
jgi:phosphatidylglycerol lysyltransferase